MQTFANGSQDPRHHLNIAGFATSSWRDTTVQAPFFHLGILGRWPLGAYVGICRPEPDRSLEQLRPACGSRGVALGPDRYRTCRTNCLGVSPFRARGPAGSRPGMSILRHVCGQIIPKARTLVLLGILNMVLNVTGDHITLRSANGESFKLPFDTVLKHCRAFRPIHAREVDGRYVDAVSPPQHHDVTFNSNELATLVSVMQNTVDFGIAAPDHSGTEVACDCTGAIRRGCRAVGRYRAEQQGSFLDPDPADLVSCS